MNHTPELAGADLGRTALHGALDILGSYGGYSAETIKAALDASSAAVNYADISHDVPDAADAYSRVHDKDEARQLARQALAALTPAEREVVEWRFGFRGAGYPLILDSVAVVTNSSPGSVRTLYYRALRKMRSALGAE